MKLPNLLIQALKIIEPNGFKYRKFNSGAVTDFGVATQAYGDWIVGTGIVQPGIISSFGGKNVSEKEYDDLGMDFSRHTVTVWVKNADLHTNVLKRSPDQLQFNGKVYNIIHVSDWDGYNGWQRCYCQEILDE